MIDTDKLRGIIASRRKTQADVARALGITPKTFYMKMERGVFGSDEIYKMAELLAIDDPWSVFFAKEAT